MKHTFKSYSDAQHGWVAVKRKLVNELGLTLSPYSHQKGQTVYIEEDGDTCEFVAKYEEKYGVKPIFVSGAYSAYSPIRSYERYSKNEKV